MNSLRTAAQAAEDFLDRRWRKTGACDDDLKEHAEALRAARAQPEPAGPEDMAIYQAMADRYAQPEQQAADWTTPTSYYQRMSDAITLLCDGKRPPEKMVFSWLDSTSEELQEFCIEHGPAWAQGIVLIDAARVMADTPTEGVDHEAHPPAQPHKEQTK